MLTTHPLLVPRLRMGRALLVPLHSLLGHEVCYRVNVYFSSILPHFILASTSWSTPWYCCFRIYRLKISTKLKGVLNLAFLICIILGKHCVILRRRNLYGTNTHSSCRGRSGNRRRPSILQCRNVRILTAV
jgi:hypothetical protein